MKAGIIWLTPENLTAEWLLSEAGALSRAGDPQNSQCSKQQRQMKMTLEN